MVELKISTHESTPVIPVMVDIVDVEIQELLRLNALYGSNLLVYKVTNHL